MAILNSHMHRSPILAFEGAKIRVGIVSAIEIGIK
jgi:hypothetical protein